jgi:hypothetical protein
LSSFLGMSNMISLLSVASWVKSACGRTIFMQLSKLGYVVSTDPFIGWSFLASFFLFCLLEAKPDWELTWMWLGR